MGLDVGHFALETARVAERTYKMFELGQADHVRWYLLLESLSKTLLARPLSRLLNDANNSNAVVAMR